VSGVESIDNRIQALVYRYKRLADKAQLVSQTLDILVEEVVALGNVINNLVNEINRMKIELENLKKQAKASSSKSKKSKGEGS